MPVNIRMAAAGAAVAAALGHFAGLFYGLEHNIGAGTLANTSLNIVRLGAKGAATDAAGAAVTVIRKQRSGKSTDQIAAAATCVAINTYSGETGDRQIWSDRIYAELNKYTDQQSRALLKPAVNRAANLLAGASRQGVLGEVYRRACLR